MVTRIRFPENLGSTNDIPYMSFKAVKYFDPRFIVDRNAISSATLRDTEGNIKNIQAAIAGVLSGVATTDTRKREHYGTVFLPLPEGLSNSISPSWDMANQQLLAIAAEGVKGLASQGSGAISTGVIAKIGFDYAATQIRQTDVFRGSTASTPNPKKQALFNGIDPRSFSWSWTLIPHSQQEAEQILNIIRFFTENSLPSLDNPNGAFFDFPNEFIIEFDSSLKGFPKIKDCVCTGVSTQFSQGGSIQLLESGHPVQTTISLSFTETQLLTKQNPGI